MKLEEVLEAIIGIFIVGIFVTAVFPMLSNITGQNTWIFSLALILIAFAIAFSLLFKNVNLDFWKQGGE